MTHFTNAAGSELSTKLKTLSKNAVPMQRPYIVEVTHNLMELPKRALLKPLQSTNPMGNMHGFKRRNQMKLKSGTIYYLTTRRTPVQYR